MTVRLSIEDWFCIEKLDLELDRDLVLVVGDHEEGKSAIRDAIAFAITGMLSREGVEQRGDLGEYAVRIGAKEAKVSLVLPTLSILRSVDRAGKQSLQVSIGGRYVEGVRAGQEAIYAELKLDEGRAVAAVDSWRFLSLPESDARALLLRTIGDAITLERITAAMDQRKLGEKETIAPMIVGTGFRAAEKFAVEQRRIAGRALEEVQTDPPASSITIDGKPLDLSKAPPAAAIRERIAALRAERDGVIQQGSELVGASRTMLASLKPQRAELEALIAERLDSLEDLNVEIDGVKGELAAAEAEAMPLRDRLTEAQTALGEADASKPSTCPALGGPCLATPKKLDERVAELRTRRANATAAKEQAARELAPVLHQIESLKESLEALRKRVGPLAKKLSDQTIAVENLPDLAKRIAHCEEVLRDHQAGTELADPREKVRALDQRIANNEAALRGVEAHAVAMEAWEGSNTRCADLQHERDSWDAIAQSLKPSGIESDLLREVLPAFVERVSEVTRATGLGVLRVDDELRISLDRAGEVWFPAQLSRSARLRLGIAIQHGIASLAGFPILVVDELDVFNQGLLPAVLAALLEQADAYEAVLGLATLRSAQPSAPPDDRVRLSWLREGVLYEVTR